MNLLGKYVRYLFSAFNVSLTTQVCKVPGHPAKAPSEELWSFEFPGYTQSIKPDLAVKAPRSSLWRLGTGTEDRQGVKQQERFGLIAESG